MADPVLTAEQVEVRYGELLALTEFTVSLAPGRLTGLIGPDGAGKTTAIRTLCGLHPPSGGSIHLGEEPLGKSRDRLAQAIGYMPQRFSLYVDLTIEEYDSILEKPREYVVGALTDAGLLHNDRYKIAHPFIHDVLDASSY